MPLAPDEFERIVAALRECVVAPDPPPEPKAWFVRPFNPPAPVRGGSDTPAVSLDHLPPSPYEIDGPPCATCGSIMIRAGSCYSCRTCGDTSGCG